MEPSFQGAIQVQRPSWAIWYRNMAVGIPDVIIEQIRASPTLSMGWHEEALKNAWKQIFPLTPTSSRTGLLNLDHPAWGLTPNPWWKFITDTPLLSWEEAERLSKYLRPSVVPHYDESGWVIQERKIVDSRGMALAHMGNHPSLKLIQVLAPVQKCDLLICCNEEILGILRYMMIWKPEWTTSKDLLRSPGWSMVDAAMMNPSSSETPLRQFVKMNILMWNCRGALNPDFKRRIFEMAVNHQPSIMVISETRIGGERAERIIEGLPFDGFITTDTIGYAGGLWVLWKKVDAEVTMLASTEQEIHATVKIPPTKLPSGQRKSHIQRSE
ncbi:uncharacterized protein LOC115968578 [Quercus lobata]|uniref:uncharacterized protein LOC115968578 n=1 Tax=Quercus lobata TaxID=97700 RepID=UPI001243C32F|nr:uncharacterized protein LOC115968578 [Quercus lobata]